MDYYATSTPQPPKSNDSSVTLSMCPTPESRTVEQSFGMLKKLDNEEGSWVDQVLM